MTLRDDAAAIAYLERAIILLRTGQATGFAGVLHLVDDSFKPFLSRSLIEMDGMDACNAIGDLMHRLG